MPKKNILPFILLSSRIVSQILSNVILSIKFTVFMVSKKKLLLKDIEYINLDCNK